MDNLTFIANLVEHLSWPVAGIVICLVLKRPLEKLLGRLQKAQHNDTVLDFGAENQAIASAIQSNISIADAIPHDPLGLIGEAELKIYETLENLKILSDADKVKVLTKHYANLQIKAGYQELNHLIFGSQIAILQALNTIPDPVEKEFFATFYEAAKKEYPDYYKGYTFDSYLNFLKTTGMINTLDGKYFLTVLGRGFLMFLSESGSSLNRSF